MMSHRMIPKIAVAVAISGLAFQSAAQAATDAGLTLNQGPAYSVQRAFGAQARLSLKFGSHKAVRPSNRLRLGLQAGPIMTLTGPSTVRSMAPLASFSLSPGYSWRMELANRPLASHYTLVGKAERRSTENPGAERLGIGTAGWVGIGVGAALIVGVLVVADMARDASD